MNDRKPLTPGQAREYAVVALRHAEAMIRAACEDLLANTYDKYDMGSRFAVRLDPLIAERERLRAMIESLKFVEAKRAAGELKP